MLQTILTRIRNDSGQTLVEYVLILSLVALTAVLGLGFMSGELTQKFTDIANALPTP